jgi:hypothetical protein
MLEELPPLGEIVSSKNKGKVFEETQDQEIIYSKKKLGEIPAFDFEDEQFILEEPSKDEIVLTKNKLGDLSSADPIESAKNKAGEMTGLGEGDMEDEDLEMLALQSPLLLRKAVS